MKKILTLISIFSLALSISIVSFATPYSPPFEVNAEAVYMANLDSNMLIFEKNAESRINANALSQLMTVILALENIENPETTMITMKSFIQDEMYESGLKYGRISLGGLYKRETLSAENLIWSVMLQSANESATMLADHVGGDSVPYFVEMMNHRAKEIGANNTNFTNPTGLPDDASYTTAYDMYLIGRHAMTVSGFSDYIESTSNVGDSDRQESILWTTNNQFIKKSSENYNPFLTTQKVAFDASDGKSSSISFAKLNGYTYMAVLLNCSGTQGAEFSKAVNQSAVFYETNRLYDWAFETFKVKTLLEKGKSFGEIPLKLNWDQDFLIIMSADNFSALIPDAIEASSIQHKLILPEVIYAPVTEGDIIGEVQLILSDEIIGRVGVSSADTVTTSRTLLLVDKVVEVTESFLFKFIVVLSILLFIAYVTFTILKNKSRRRYKTNVANRTKKQP